ncbi:hypothetical protein CISIN_1g042697mg [Citrus sinensis]|uniref:DUF4005 domain-containing protein n=1 Tax=Citrus sinensis TaxID=2711 RepID=A0A067DNJ0_CITSI|nr:hypothetical protein CISIN_1g042697mg [Citrus sinensis]
MSWLINSIEVSIGKTHLFLPTAKDVWDAVRETYSDLKNSSQILELKTRLCKLGKVIVQFLSRPKRSVRRNPAANVDSITVHSTPKFEISKRSLKKALSQLADPVHENPQSELEKVKRSLRKVNNPLVENSAFVQSEFEIEKQNHSLDKLPTSSICHEGLEWSLRYLGEKMKKKTTLKQSKLPKVEAMPNLVEMNEMSDSGAKDKTIPMTNGNFEPKEDSTNNENNKSSRKVDVLTKKECVENELQSSPSLPSYIAATESAKAKLRLQGSSRSSEDGAEKNSGTGRHSRFELPYNINFSSSKFSHIDSQFVSFSMYLYADLISVFEVFLPRLHLYPNISSLLNREVAGVITQLHYLCSKSERQSSLSI